MSKEVILTGIRANNDLHIGNYFGALLPMVDMAKSKSDQYQINLFVPDLHSFTTPIDHSKLQAQIMHNLKIFVAAGLPLDNDNIHIYRQSYIPAHSEMTWILDCFTGFGEMSRMTQFKEKRFLASDHQGYLARILGPVARGETNSITSLDARRVINIVRGLVEYTGPLNDKDEATMSRLLAGDYSFSDMTDAHSLHRTYQDRVSFRTKVPLTLGLFNYPVLMAADILLYGAKYVPVGDDQTQHLEFTRDVAERMNKQFGDLFVVPEPVAKQHEFFGKDQGLRIKDLADPTKKMSKSDDSGKGIIFLGDSPEEAAQKVMSATTDSESVVGNPDFSSRPGVANLLQILDLLNPGHPAVEQMSYKDFKETVADAVKEFLTDFQAKLSEVDESAIMRKLESDESKMNEVANTTLLKVQKAVGLRPA